MQYRYVTIVCVLIRLSYMIAYCPYSRGSLLARENVQVPGPSRADPSRSPRVMPSADVCPDFAPCSQVGRPSHAPSVVRAQLTRAFGADAFMFTAPRLRTFVVVSRVYAGTKCYVVQWSGGYMLQTMPPTGPSTMRIGAPLRARYHAPNLTRVTEPSSALALLIRPSAGCDGRARE